MTREEFPVLPIPWRSQIIFPDDAHALECGVYSRRVFKLMCRSFVDALAAPSSDAPTDKKVQAAPKGPTSLQSHIQRIRTANEETAQLMSSPGAFTEQAAQQLHQHAPKLFPAASTHDTADLHVACQLLEVLSEFQLLPFAAHESELQPVLVTAPQMKMKAAAAPVHTHACFGAHFGTGFAASAAVLSAHVHATRQKLLWELRDFGPIEDSGAICKAVKSIAALAAHNTAHGLALLLHIPAYSSNNEPPSGLEHSAQVAAAAALALAPGGCFVTQLLNEDEAPASEAPSALEVASIAGAVFESVYLYHPSCAPFSGAPRRVWLIARNKRRLSQEAADSIAKACRLFVDNSLTDEQARSMPVMRVPQDLRENFVAAGEWAAERAEAELAYAKLTYAGSDGSNLLEGLGQRWATFFDLSNTIQARGINANKKGWLKNPPAPKAAPRIPAGLAQQHMEISMPGDEPQPVLEPSAAASIDAPLFNPDALMTQPTPSQNILESSVPAFMDAQLRTAEAPTAGVPVDTAMGAEQQVQEFQGELMTFNDAKGWERVALVQSRGWPEGVPVPQRLRVSKFAAKAANISRFWALEPRSQVDSQQLTSLLGYLNRPASSLGGRKRMGVVRAEDGDKVDLGLVAGSDGSGGIGGIMFCLRDAQMS